MAESRQQRRARERAEAKAAACGIPANYPAAWGDGGVCNGAEITHEDGFVECEAGSQCGGGVHLAGYTCSMRVLGMGKSSGAEPLIHACEACH